MSRINDENESYTPDPAIIEFKSTHPYIQQSNILAFYNERYDNLEERNGLIYEFNPNIISWV